MALADVQGIITAARQAASDAQSRAANYSDNAQMAAGSTVDSGPITYPVKPSLPAISAPSVSLRSIFDDTKGEIGRASCRERV